MKPQRGLSLVELMVGIAIGLMLVATATTVLSQHLRETRALVLEARLMQDLRAVTDVMSRDLRRAGYWREAGDGVWSPTSSTPVSNPYAEVAVDGATRLAYSREDGTDALAYRLRQGVVEMQWGASPWQAMTDANTMTVSALTVTPREETLVLKDFCALPCPTDGSSGICPPRQTIRSMALSVQARSTVDPAVLRQMDAEVRLRNDTLVGACPT